MGSPRWPWLALAVFWSAPLVCTAAGQESVARVIVKFRDDGNLLRQASAAGRATALGARLGLVVEHGLDISQGKHVLSATGLTSEALAARLGELPEVEYAEPDRLRKIRSTPNDTLYAEQWYLQSVQAAGSNFSGAWGISAGRYGTIVAVIDTGITNHPDLTSKTVPGYNFISSAAMAGNSTGRSSDPTDTGDYIDAAARQNTELQALCGTADLATDQPSSWHGTIVSGLVGASTNNGAGMAGAGWDIRILPLRALGKCGGFDSDIQAAMLWAAGLYVPGAPTNKNPARVVNMSLGGGGTCTQSYQEVIAQLNAEKVLVVAAAGNESGPVDVPANCAGALAVAGIRHEGDKVGYSSYGAEVGISAPAGNCVNVGANEPCLFPIISTTNLGTQQAGASGYSDQYKVTIGTSFSVPLAAATAALMLDVNPALTPAQVISGIKSSARPFVAVAGLSTCPVANSHGQCNCTTATCGAGMLDAAAAVRSAVQAPMLRDAIYTYGQSYNGRGDKMLVGVNCDVFQLVLDVESGYTNLGMGQAATLDSAIASRTAYVDRIDTAASMFAYALYGNQPVKTFVFDDPGNAASSATIGSGSAFGYCYSTNANAHVYFEDKAACTSRYSNGATKSCAVADNGATGVASSGLVLRDAIYVYDQSMNASGDKVLVGENCDVFQLVLDVTGGYTDLALARGAAYESAIKWQLAYPDRIQAAASMFSYALYDDQAVKAFAFKDKGSTGSTASTGTATAFGYCYSTKANPRVYFRENDKCTYRTSDGVVHAISPCTPAS
jgi:serine protease